MSTAIQQLLDQAHRALSPEPPHLPPMMTAAAGALAAELLALLEVRNGFFAWGPALHVFPSQSSDMSWGLVDWNMPGLWKQEYLSFADPGLCFAEDIFGDQFTLRDGAVHHFSIETGQIEKIADSLEAWAALILEDSAYWTGWPLADDWKERHGRAVPLHQRLYPVKPFVVGGGYELDNLRPVDSSEMMAARAIFAYSIHNLPDGTKIRIVLDDDEDES